MNVDDWNDFITTENSHKFMTDIIESILTQVDSRIADIHMEGIVFPKVVDYACSLIDECLKLNDYFCDEVDVEEEFQFVDAEPKPPRIDPWAKAPFEYIQDDSEYKELMSLNYGSMNALSSKSHGRNMGSSYLMLTKSAMAKVMSNTSIYPRSINNLNEVSKPKKRPSIAISQIKPMKMTTLDLPK